MTKQAYITIGAFLGISLSVILAYIPKEEGKELAFVKPEITAIQKVPAYINADWANNKVWYDGNAEVNKYDASMVIYGKKRQFEYVYVFVKEDFTPEYRVKTDNYNEKDIYPVMKCNQFARVPTENYPYHFLTSLFFRWENPSQLHKLATSSQEWCGNTFKEYLEKKDGFDFIYHSYWDEQGDGKASVGQAWFEDQLPYTLRALNFKDGLTFKYALYPTEKHSKARIPQATEANFKVTEEEQQWKVEVSLGSGRSSTFWFGKGYPNKLLKQRTWYGLDLDLKDSQRYPYWAYTP